MNRTDRLLGIILLLQSRRMVTAEQVAAHFEISVRTVYRDLSALSEIGVPIAAEPGVGYSLLKGYHLPPVMFSEAEASALFTGGEIVKGFTDSSLAGPMDSALLTFSLEWLGRWVLSFGDEAEAVAPKRLRELVGGEAEEVARLYAKTPAS